MNVLDALLILVALSFGFSGYRQGFLVGALSFAGFLGGAILGMIIAPRVIGNWESGFVQALVAVAIVLAGAGLGQFLLGFLGARLRGQVTWRPLRFLDSTAGAAISIVALLIFSWFLASALRDAPLPRVNAEIRSSSVLGAVDRAMPDQARGLFSSFRVLLDENGLPRVFTGLSAEPIRPVEPPSGTAAATPAVRVAASSIVKVHGNARACERSVDGSGFVYAPHRVLTNAHVVAGVRNPTVQIGGEGRRYDADTVLYDPRRDIAVLAVPELEARPLQFAGPARRGDEAVVAGFPHGGPYRAEPVRVREVLDARGHDIYGGASVTREVISLFGSVQPGNSGGPLLSPEGTVYGMVFAKSLDDAETGYALTVDEIRSAARAGLSASGDVRTAGCTAE